jgi:phosphatidylglycerophosphate synthase
MARRISRPAALRVTRVVARWGISANAATLFAWACGVAAAAAFSWGTLAGWLAGAAVLQLWYLLDHVDGQLARLYGTASLDGAQLDYLMHHTVNLLIPLGIGWGLFIQAAQPAWHSAGVAWGLSLLMLGLHYDARYKAFVHRLQRSGMLLHVGGSRYGRSTIPRVAVQEDSQRQQAIRRGPIWLAGRCVRKACEIHVVMNTLTVLAVVAWLTGDRQLFVARCYLALASVMAPALVVWTIGRSQREQACEREFEAWFRLIPADWVPPENLPCNQFCDPAMPQDTVVQNKENTKSSEDLFPISQQSS